MTNVTLAKDKKIREISNEKGIKTPKRMRNKSNNLETVETTAEFSAVTAIGLC